jgi:uncharacterized membrane protein
VLTSPDSEKVEEAMIARFDHRPMLTALLALTTTVLVVVVITLATLLITAAPPAATSSSEGGGANPGAAAAPANMAAGAAASHGSYDIYSHSRAGDSQTSGAGSDIERHAEVVAAYNK